MLSVSASIDYSFDTQNFFDTAEKRAVLQAAADSIVDRFEDDLLALSPSGGNTWSATFFHPGTGSTQSVSNLNVGSDEIVIYAGGRNLGSTLGQGGPGGFSVGGSSSWISRVQTRGESGASANPATDFGPWGGSIAFNTTTNWHISESTVGLDGGEFDLYSVAVHELSHLFGFGTAGSFDGSVSGSVFAGAESVEAYDGTGNVPLDNGHGHWANGTTDGGVETAMDPSISSGVRKDLTPLDLAALADVGWEVDLDEAPQTKLGRADLAATDWFGYSVDIDGDTAVVGTPLDDDSGSASGAAYIFHFDGLIWSEEAKLTASDGAAVDQFGWSVAIDGDTVVVGAYLEDSTVGSNAGSAYVFQRNEGGANNWGEIVKIKGSGTTAGDKFGFDVDISGDTIVVGAEHDDPAGSASGAAYVFNRNEGGANNWGEVAALGSTNPNPADLFGYSVSIDGDFLVVGSRFGHTTTNDTGSAFVFARNQGGLDNWGVVRTISASDAAKNDQFGYSVAISGNTVAVSSRLDDQVRSNTGSVYLFDRHEGGANNWGLVQKVTASDATPGAQLGTSVDLDGDDLVIGAIYAQTSGRKVGGVYHMSRDVGGTDQWGQVAKVTADDHAYNDRFGADVAISGNHLLSGAYLEDPNRVSSGGSAYIALIAPGGGSASESLRMEPAIPESNVVESLDDLSDAAHAGLRRELRVASALEAERVDAAFAHLPREPWQPRTVQRSKGPGSSGDFTESTEVDATTQDWLNQLETLTNLV